MPAIPVGLCGWLQVVEARLGTWGYKEGSISGK